MAGRGGAILLIMAALASCKTVSDTTVKDAGGAVSSGSPGSDGEWTPLVSLKDMSTTFTGSHEVPRPDNGWWVAPIHVNLLASGKVLVTGWSRPKESSCENHQGRLNGTTFLLDTADLATPVPKTLSIVPIDEHPKESGNDSLNQSPDVLYCSGHAPLPDGRILFMGGARYLDLGVAGFTDFTQQEFGLPYARIYSPSGGNFSVVTPDNPGDPQPPNAANWALPYQPGMMWYPTNTRLPGGKIMTNGGFARWIDVLDSNKWQYLNRSVTIFDAAAYDQQQNPWQVWVQAQSAPREVSADVFDYPHVFVLPTPVVVNGLPRQVAIYGGLAYDPNDSNYQPGITLLSLDPNVPEAQRFAAPAHGRRPNGGDNNAGKMSESTAALTATGEILVMGGGNDGLREGQRLDLYNPATDQWRSVDPSTSNQGITRHKGASTLLPDGTILIANGEEFYESTRNTGDRRQVTLFDPKTNALTNLKAWPGDPDMRGYHSVSLLLQDGRVLIGGGRIYQNSTEGAYRIGCERPELRIFSPPYLFKGPRPVVQNQPAAAPIDMALGTAPIKINYSGPDPQPGSGVVLMALGAFTHGFDQNQRYVRLSFQKVGSGQLLVTPPVNSQLAPEGQYNLFLVSTAGVPSVGLPVKVH